MTQPLNHSREYMRLVAHQIVKVTKAYVRTYSDNGQITAYVEWIDGRGRTGRTEGSPANAHMQALMARAERDGNTVAREVW